MNRERRLSYIIARWREGFVNEIIDASLHNDQPSTTAVLFQCVKIIIIWLVRRTEQLGNLTPTHNEHDFLFPFFRLVPTVRLWLV